MTLENGEDIRGTITGFEDDLGPTYWVKILGTDGQKYSINRENFIWPEGWTEEQLIGKHVRLQYAIKLEIEE